MKKFTASLMLVCCLYCSSIYATWYKGNAQHPINDMNFDEVRARTIKNAIANAALKSSSYIRAEDIALDGLLLSSKTILQSEGQIRRVDIISEKVSEGILTVVVNVDVKSFSDCQQSRYAKSVLITQFPLIKPLQARTGAIFDFDRHVSKRLERQLTSHPKLVTTQLLKILTTQTDSVGTIETHKLLEKALYLANLHQKQFVLFGFIRDISLFEQVKDNLLIDETSTRRNFTLQVYLIDAISGKFIIDKSYHSEANWQYPQNHQVDTNNSLFWRKDFGRSVLNTINSAVTDITAKLQCHTVLPQILKIENSKVFISLGRDHGVKIGDTFEAIHQRNIYTNLQQAKSILLPNSTMLLTVIESNAHFSVLEGASNIPLDNLQLNDYVRPTLTF